MSRWAEIVGAVSSMLMLDTVNVATFPALSVAVPVTAWFAPSPSVVGPDRLSRPESASLPLKLTVTSALYQLLIFADRSADPLIVGAVLSILTLVTEAVALFPARSVTVNVCACAAPSGLNVYPPLAGEFSPDSASEAL